MKTFAELFKKYRLRAEFGTLSEFADALSEKGFHCEESLFSHWQKGTRVPTNRELLLKILEIFVEKDAIENIDDANNFIAVTGLGYLTENEKASLNLKNYRTIPFQVPNEIQHFTGRDVILKKIQTDIVKNSVLLISGSPGVGKTALAIKIGHILRSSYPDGVLWYKVDSSNIMDILLSIGKMFGEDMHSIKDVDVRASIIRTLLSRKRVLLIFDNVTRNDTLSHLIPNSPLCRVVFTSRESSLPLATKYLLVPLQTFTQNESLDLFEKIFDKKYVAKNNKEIIAINNKIGFLPLAVNLAAAHMKQYSTSPQKYLQKFDENEIDLEEYTYEDRSLFHAIALSYSPLDSQVKNVFVSLGVFEGKDFSIESVAYINKLTEKEIEKNLQQLLDISFIEPSKSNRFRIHPLMRAFTRRNLNDSKYYLRAASFYEKKLIQAQESKNYKQLLQEADNIIFIVKQCYEAGYWDQIITIWNPLEKFLSDTNEIKKLRQLTEKIDTSPSINIVQKILTIYFTLLVICWITITILGLKTSIWNYIYPLLLTVLPFVGGLIGIFRSKFWGLFKSNIGKAIFNISLGSLCWAIGNIIWAYYNFILKVDLPYPSFADLGFFPTYFFWIAGITFLVKATGAKFGFNRFRGKFLLLLIPFTIFILSYYFLFFIIKRSFLSETPMRIFLDIYYPMMDIVILTLATIIFSLSVNFFGGKYRISLFTILGGFIMMYISDFGFSYTTSIGVYYNGGITDLLFTCAFYLLTLGTLSFYFTPKSST